MTRIPLPALGLLLLMNACGSGQSGPSDRLAADSARVNDLVRPEIYAPVRLTADLQHLSAKERAMLPLLMQAASIMDSIFWTQAWGTKDSLPVKHVDAETRTFFGYNYGPWDRMDGDRPFVVGVGAKPLGARFYPADMTAEEFNGWNAPGKNSAYTVVRRDSAGALVAIPYHSYYRGPLERASDLLLSASALAEAPGLRRYLTLRAAALLSDDYDASDRAWLDMKDNTVELIIGPIENYEDQLYGIRTAHSAYIAIKDHEWSRKLDRFAALLPRLQRELPVEQRYRNETPGSDAQLGAYEVLYYAGDCNAGGKTIAVNLPNDERIQLEKGTRRLQFKNVMRAKFERMVDPIGRLLVAPEQRKHLSFEAFFQDVMFHEVAHGLGIKHTVNGKGTVREALLDEHGAWEEGKADILGLWMVSRLRELGEISTGEMLDDHVTFLAGMFRSVRFGASSAHGKANMFRFNYLMERGAYQRDAATGTYRVVPDVIDTAVAELCALILRIQGDGDLEELQRLMARYGGVTPELRADLDRLSDAGIPVDIVFDQGASVLGLRPAP